MTEATPGYLQNLSARQHEAVTADPAVPLQILAGPGSGKTRVLTSRIVHLIEHHGILPNEIVAVTFTNKSATEMKVRLTASIGLASTSQLILGTFHATCVRYLRRYASHIGIPNNFTVQDSDDSLKLVKAILPDFADEQNNLEAKLDGRSVLDLIGKAKSKGKTPMMLEREGFVEKSPVTDLVAKVYTEYEARMQATDALDFEDLLLRGAELFRQEPWVLKSVKHIFVDEFQDTNVTQYGLLRLFAKESGCVTIVGDPDQSIYGWRSADIENLSHMVRDFPKTQIILLEDNFRSTGAILAASYAVISQDTTRHAKGLVAFHGAGSSVVCKRLSTAETEASFIAAEVKRLKTCTGLEWSDFAILLRYGALSRPIEQAFQSLGIPNRMAAGHKFFDRAEIKTVLAYLQLADNPNFSPAFSRAVNVPKRGIGDKTLANIISSGQAAKVSPVAMSRRGRCNVKLSTSARSAMDEFLKVIDQIKKLADQGKTVDQLIEVLLKSVDFEKHWKEDKWEDRLENIKELVNYSAIVASNVANQAELAESVDLGDEEDLREVPPPSTPLRAFLEASMLSTDMTTHDEEANTPKVVISTVHAAKGLEWPVVFVPCVEEGIFPFYRCEGEKEIMEERRLLYVAMTRAQALLYTSYSKGRMVNGQFQEKKISPFLPSEGAVKTRTSTLPTIDATSRKTVMAVLGRPPVDEAAIALEIENAGPAAQLVPDWEPDADNRPSYSSRFARGGFFDNTGRDEFALPPMRRSVSPTSSPPPFSARSPERKNRPRTGPSAAETLGGFARASSLGGFTVPSANSRSASVASSSTSTSSGPPPRVPTGQGSRHYPQGGGFKRKLVSPPPMRDPDTKTLPLRLATADRYALPPMNPLTTSSAHRSTHAVVPTGGSMGLERFTSQAASGLSLMKGLGLPPAEDTAPPVVKKKRLGMGRAMVPWGEEKKGGGEKDAGGARKKPRP